MPWSQSSQVNYSALSISSFIAAPFPFSPRATCRICSLQRLLVAKASAGRSFRKSTGGQRSWLRRVYWLTHETNATAMKLYDKVAEKSGFVVYRKNF